ncbi:hypothetical protein EDC56_1850 [Sinobacterium caligoides]|uniref:Uncharacterized protein n=1 Tax=Sinobacterium caligoides TaxID=933926 RepID=A0A3N2DP16_9GAMM|nr:hypothetical protein [Sinobacterium caligoides]ROS01409.1 hypothetical protein EDC56_1850 [Sinobacterium caligoides]
MKLKMILTLALPLISLIITPTLFANSDENIRACKKINSNIARYEAKRRKGGSAKKMNHWLHKIHLYEDQYSEKDCMKYRRWL